MDSDAAGRMRDVWIQCPHCRQVYYIERSFYDPPYDRLPLFCPHCRQSFDKKDAPQTWGL
jgi:hypothetical protein